MTDEAITHVPNGHNYLVFTFKLLNFSFRYMLHYSFIHIFATKSLEETNTFIFLVMEPDSILSLVCLMCSVSVVCICPPFSE